MTDWASSEPTTGEETSLTMPSLNLPSLTLNNVLQWLEKNMPQIPGVTPPIPGAASPLLQSLLGTAEYAGLGLGYLPTRGKEILESILGIVPIEPSRFPSSRIKERMGELLPGGPTLKPLIEAALGAGGYRIKSGLPQTQAEFPVEEGLAELMKTTMPEAEVTPKVTMPTLAVSPEEGRVPIEAQVPTTREPKEGEPILPLPTAISPTVVPPTIATPAPGWKGLPPGLLEGMTPEQFSQQLEGILAQRPKTVTELAGPVPREGAQGPWMVRALQNFGIKLAGGDPDKWRAQEQLRLDTIWTKNLELAMLNMNARQQTEFMKLNFAIKADEEKRKGAQDFLTNAAKNKPGIEGTEGWQRSAMAAWRLPAEAINEWIESHRDPKTGELTNLYMSPTEQFVKEIAAKFTLITTMFPDIDKEKLPIFLLGGKWPEFERSFVDRIGKKLMSAKPEEREGLLKLLAQYKEMTEGEGWKFPSKLENFSAALGALVKAGQMKPAEAKKRINDFVLESYVPKTIEAEAKIKEERIKAGAGAGKAAEEEKRYKLGALKGGDLGVFSFIPGGKAYLAGKTDEAIAQATTFRLALNKYLSGEKLDNDEKRMLGTWQAAQVKYLGGPTGLNKGQLYQQIRKLTGTELSPRQLDAVIQMVEQKYPDSVILNEFKPKK